MGGNVQWLEKEEENFKKWRDTEIEEWKMLDYYEYTEIPLGIENDGRQSIWQQDVYRELFSYVKNYDHFFAYTFQTKTGEDHVVDVRLGTIDVRLSFSINSKSFAAEMYFKQKHDLTYWNIGEFRGLKGKERKQFETVISSLDALYEAFKEIVCNKPSHRLRLLTNNVTLDEKTVIVVKGYIRDYLINH